MIMLQVMNSEEQLPYLKAVKVEYIQQQVVEGETWKVSFNMESNENNKLWKPEMQVKDQVFENK